MKIAPGGPLDVALRWSKGDELPVGRLAWRDRQVYFEYSRECLDSGLQISPLRLAARPGVLQGDAAQSGLPGVFSDSLPDAWGRLLVDRRATQVGVRPAELTPLDRLACVGDRGVGALVYRPAIELPESVGALDLDALAADARTVIEGDTEEVLEALLFAGGSPGGARPKVLVAEKGGRLVHGAGGTPAGHRPLLVKFGAPTDPADIGPIELAYARMAVAAGLSMMPSELLPARAGPGYFATERFDRPPRHAHTLAGLLHTDHRVPNLDYDHLLRVTLHLTRDQRQVDQAFRRMVFNVLAHNRDDHGKQFTFLMDRDGTWRLAPAYDLTFSEGPGGQHAMTVDGHGRPGCEPVQTLARRAGVTNAARSIGEVRDAVARWPEFAADAGVSAASKRRIVAALDRSRAGRGWDALN